MQLLAVFASMLAIAAATPTEYAESQVDKRNSAAVHVRVWGSGACDSGPVFDGQYTPGGCQNIGGTTFGVKFDNPNQNCVFKFWQNEGCSGKATTWHVGGSKSTGCVPLANQGGNFVLTSGAKSFIANCAMDSA